MDTRVFLTLPARVRVANVGHHLQDRTGPVPGLTGVHQVAPYTKNNAVADIRILDDRLEEITEQSATIRRWVVVKAANVAFLDDMRKAFFKHDIVGGISMHAGAITMLMKKRRMTNACLSFVSCAALLGFTSSFRGRGADPNRSVLRVMLDFLESGSTVVANYIIGNPSIKTVQIDKAIDTVVSRTKKMSHEEFEP